jgi:Olfactomedin-like domain
MFYHERQSKDYIYSTGYNYFDMSVDENGLWTVYTLEATPDFLLVSKHDLDDLTIQKTWTISSARPKAFGNGWITCGVLYLVRDVTSEATQIDFAYDLYTKQELNVSLRFNNPYRMNNMIAYNYQEKTIYSWDMRHLLTYPLLL